MSGSWKEAKDRLVNLPDDDPTTFNCYLHFMYTGTLAITLSGPTQSYVLAMSSTTGAERCALTEKLADLYVLAEKLQDITTKNAVLEAMLLNSRKTSSKVYGGRWYPGLGAVSKVYKGTPASSPTRKLLVDIFTCQGDSSWLFMTQYWPTDFVREVAVQLLEKRARPVDHTMTCDISIYAEKDTKKKT